MRTQRTEIRRLIALVCALLLPLSAQAGLIRDAEIENTLHAYANPIFTAAGIEPTSVRILIVNSPETQLLRGGRPQHLHQYRHHQGSENGRHAHRRHGARDRPHRGRAFIADAGQSGSRATLGMRHRRYWPGAAAVIGGSHEAGAGIIMGSQSMAQHGFLSDIRLNEESADNAALKFLDANDISAAGMLEMFEVLRLRESGGGTKDPYLTNHPLTTSRIQTMRDHVTESKIPKDQVPDGFQAMHERMRAKLIAFTEPYETALKTLPTERQIRRRALRTRHGGVFQHANLLAALAGMNELLKQYPKDPFFYDTKGQILFEKGKVAEASAAYAKANGLKPDSALITTEYAKTLIAQNNPAELGHAVALLERSKELDDSYDVTWRQLAIAYGLEGKLGLSYEALAEEAAHSGDYEGVIQHVARARANAANDSSLILQPRRSRT